MFTGIVEEQGRVRSVTPRRSQASRVPIHWIGSLMRDMITAR